MNLATYYTPWRPNLSHLRAPAFADRSPHRLWVWIENWVGWEDAQSWAVTLCSVVPMPVSTGAAPATTQTLLTPSCTIFAAYSHLSFWLDSSWHIYGIGCCMCMDQSGFENQKGKGLTLLKTPIWPFEEKKRKSWSTFKDVKQPTSKHTYLK